MKIDSFLQKLVAAFTTGVGIEALDDETLDGLASRVQSERLARDRRRRSHAPVSQRTLAIEVLNLLGVPASPKTIAETVHARTGLSLDARSLTTARRDDRRSWMRDRNEGRAQEPRIAPALHHETVQPVRALVTVSTWRLNDRMVTPTSPRTDRASTVLALLDEANRLSGTDMDAAVQLSGLACKLAVGIPGVPVRDPLDREAVRRAMRAELAGYSTGVTEERTLAAQHAMVFDEATRIWGRTDSRKRW